MQKAKLKPLTTWSVPASALRRTVSENELGFSSTEELKLSESLIGQDRALQAIQFGCEMGFGKNRIR